MPRGIRQDDKISAEKAVAEEQVNNQRFRDLLRGSGKVIFRAKSWFPLDLFPDEIVVTLSKIDVIYNEFFTKRIQPVYYFNVLDVFVYHGIFFSKLILIDSGFKGHTIEIDRLKKGDASEAQEVIQGLVVSVRQGIDLTKIQQENFIYKVKQIGKPRASVAI